MPEVVEGRVVGVRSYCKFLSVVTVASMSYSVQNQAVSVRIWPGDRKHTSELNGETLE